MDRAPLVSFVVPCYNYGRFLPDCLRGIFSQEEHQDLEIIAIDDGSTDDTLEVLRAHADPRLRVLPNERNRGHVYTVNRGLEAARGKYVVRVDPDDRHRPRFLAQALAKLEAFPEVGLVYGGVALIDDRGRVTHEPSRAELKEDSKGNELLRILEKNYICAPTVVARREAWMAAWPVPEGLAFNDWYFNVMLARRHEYYYVAEVLADYRVHGQNHHSKVIRDRTEEASVLWVLDKVYSEVEATPALQQAKQAARNRVYAKQYLDFAEKYFFSRMTDDARRCYLAALRLDPGLAREVGVMRRFAGALFGQERYERAKAFYARLGRMRDLLR